MALFGGGRKRGHEELPKREREEVPSRGQPTAVDSLADAVADDALDTLAALLRALGEYGFDTPNTPKSDLERTCESWAMHVLTGAEVDGHEQQPTAAPAPGSVAPRRWGPLREFLRRRRKEEKSFVESRLTELRDVIWDFVDGMRQLVRESRGTDGDIRLELDALESAARRADPDALRTQVHRTVHSIGQSLETRRANMEREMRSMSEKLQATQTDLREVQRQMSRDPLTQVYNRGAFDLALRRVSQLSGLSGDPFSLLMVDLDHFKRINDTLGHPAGDRVLQVAANCIVRAFPRRTDFVARYGGEEFAVVLEGADLDTASRLAERLVHQMAARHIDVDGHVVRVTCSVGVATVGVDDTPDSLVGRADAALYRAKARGRNCAERG